MKHTILTLILGLFLTQSVWADPQALLISLEQYAKDSQKLQFVKSDISELNTALTNNLGFQVKSSIDLDVSPSATSDSRYRDSALKLITNWTAGVPEDEIALIYLAGHGIKGEDGKLYWAMNNFNQEKWAETTIAVSEVREILEKCKAKHKLLLLDACHSGESKDLSPIDSRTIEVEKTAQEFSSDTHLTTIASSSTDQLSWLWSDMKHSLFTYWLIMALNGAADNDGDNKITFDELKNYLMMNVSITASKILNQPQCPTFLNESALDDSFSLQGKVYQLDPMFDFLAQQIDAQMRIHKLSKLAIPEFSSGESFNYVDGSVALMTKEASEKLRSKLKFLKIRYNSSYEILEENATNELLEKVKMNEIGTSKTANLMSVNTSEGEEAGILMGNIQRHSECGLKFSCKLIGQNGGSKAEFNSIALLKKQLKSGAQISKPDYEELGMLGQSFLVPDPFETSEPEIPNEQTKHPLADRKVTSSFCSVVIRTRPAGSDEKFTERKFRFNKNRCDVTIQNGEEYEIRILNKSGKELFAKILVDGLNTLPQKVNDEWKFHPRTSIKDARPWLISKDSKTITIPGFFIPEGLGAPDKNETRGMVVKGNNPGATYYRFTITDADESYAGRDGFTSQLGIITIGIYNSVSGRGGTSTTSRGDSGTIGKTEGKTMKVETYKGKTHPGSLRMVVNIHYSTND